jgi:hypothetical protein
MRIHEIEFLIVDRSSRNLPTDIMLLQKSVRKAESPKELTDDSIYMAVVATGNSCVVDTKFSKEDWIVAEIYAGHAGRLLMLVLCLLYRDVQAGTM